MPEPLSSDLEETFPVSYQESLNTVLQVGTVMEYFAFLLKSSPQLEVLRYNTLIGLVRSALADLAGALKGSIIMSLEIEDTLEAVRKASIPLPWLLQVNLEAKKSFPKELCLTLFLICSSFGPFFSSGLPE